MPARGLHTFAWDRVFHPLLDRRCLAYENAQQATRRPSGVIEWEREKGGVPRSRGYLTPLILLSLAWFSAVLEFDVYPVSATILEIECMLLVG